MGYCKENSIGCSAESSNYEHKNVSSNGFEVDMGGDWNYKENVNASISEYDSMFKKIGKTEGINVDWRLIAAICRQESGFKKDAKNQDAYGLFQFITTTWKTYAPKEKKNQNNRSDTDAQGEAFTKLFKSNLQHFNKAATRNDQIALAIQSHHDGSVNGTTWAERELTNNIQKTNESKAYLPKILEFYRKYCK